MTTASHDNYLQVASLHVAFGDVTAVDGVDLRLSAGRTLCLLGPSGCGKTTILRSIAGLLQPDAGSIRLDDSDLLRLPIHRRDIGMVFQTWALFPHMSVAANVGYGLKMRKVPGVEITRRVREALRMVRLEHTAGRRPSELSGGQQQRVALARALVTNPRLLLLDEPLSSLDLRTRVELRKELRRITTELGQTCIYVTHDHSEALALSDVVAVMSGGRVIEVGEPTKVFTRPRTRYVAEFLGNDNIVPVEPSGESTVRLPDGSMVGVPLDPADEAASSTAIAVSPWDVSFAPDGGYRGHVVDLEQQAGQALVTVAASELGIALRMFCRAAVPTVGEQVAVAVDWSSAYRLTGSSEPDSDDQPLSSVA